MAPPARDAGSHSSGPTSRTHAGQSRGYSSCGAVATSASEREMPVCTYGSGPSPSRARHSLYSRRPRSSPPATSRSVPRQSARPSPVRGSRAPIEYGAKPGGRCGYRCGTRVATGTPSSSAASAGAGVRMSDTATSGANERTTGRVSTAARTAAAYGCSGASTVGNTWYSGAAANVMPAASAGSCQRRHVCSATSWPRATSASPNASIGNA